MLNPTRRLLRYRAGPAALRLLRREGLGAGQVGAVVGPASGPKWLVQVGFDQALVAGGLLRGAKEAGENGTRPLLAGSSAGAWRMLALATPDPSVTLQGLLEGYVGQVFDRHDTPQSISEAYRKMLSRLFPPMVIDHLLDHPSVDLGIHVARVRGRLARSRRMQALQMAVAGATNLVSPKAVDWFFERWFLTTAPERLPEDFRARVAALQRDNLLAAARATGAVPYYLDFIDDLPGVRRGVFVDGGVTDYHLDQRFIDGDDRLVLLPHYQRRIAPSWFDKRLERRVPRPAVADHLLQVYPSDDFVATLPGGRLPDRDEFITYMDQPEKRIRRWYEAASLSERLGEELLADLEGGRIADLAEPLSV